MSMVAQEQKRRREAVRDAGELVGGATDWNGRFEKTDFSLRIVCRGLSRAPANTRIRSGVRQPIGAGIRPWPASRGARKMVASAKPGERVAPLHFAIRSAVCLVPAAVTA